MTTITVPRKLIREKNLVVISRKDYEELLGVQKLFHFAKPTRGELKTIARGRKEVRSKKVTPWRGA